MTFDKPFNDTVKYTKIPSFYIMLWLERFGILGAICNY
jgi:hypothetical protein